MMKQLALLTGLTICLSLSAREAHAASTNALSVRFNLTAYVQQPEQEVHQASATNYVFTTTKVKFGTGDMLNLLKAEFPAFPQAGVQLGLTFGNNHFVILDRAGNVLQDVSTNAADSSYVFSLTNNPSGVETGKFTLGAKQVTETLNQMQSDFVLHYADGKGNNFSFGGLVTTVANGVLFGGKNQLNRVSMLVPSCSGWGTFYNPADQKYDPALFMGLWTASGANLPVD